MTEHWNEHSLDFSRRSDKKFDSAEGNWDENNTGFSIDTKRELTEQEMETRRQEYAEPNPTIANLRTRHEYTKHVRADPSYRFLMMVAAFSKKKLGTIMNVKRRLSTTVTNTSEKSGQMYFNSEANRYGIDTTAHFPNNANTKKSETKEDIVGMDDGDDGDEVGENTGKVGGQAWLTMPEISGSIQLTPEVYGHIVEAQTIVESFSNRPITLKDLVETPRYQTLFARLVAIRMGLTKYFYSSDKQKDRIFSRLHQEQSMLLRRIRIVKRKPTRDFTGAGSY